MTTLLEKLGGPATIRAVVEAFYVRVWRDPLLAPFFDGIAENPRRREHLLSKQSEFFCHVLGGTPYSGRDMVAAHQRLAIEQRHFNRVAQHLTDTLNAAGVAKEHVTSIMNSVAALAPTIVNTPDKSVALREAVKPHLERLGGHRLYTKLTSPERVRVFMEHHVFCVWDFMCLLKSLQREVTCVVVPWVPKGDAHARRFINEIVVGEESDEVNGRVFSHFEMYLEAMRDVGANTSSIERFVKEIEEGHLLHVAMTRADVPAAAREFVMSTMDVVNVGRAHAVAAAFTVGREKAIPSMFLAIIEGLAVGDKSFDMLLTYLKRHVEVDSEDHGPLAENLLAALCGTDSARWHEAIGAAIGALQARARLWDAIEAKIEELP